MNTLFLLVEIVQLTNFFLEYFAGSQRTWESITLYSITISRLMANIYILVAFEKCTTLTEADFSNKKTN